MARVMEAKPGVRILELAAGDDRDALQNYINELEPGEAVRVILRLTPQDQERVLLSLAPADAADLLEDIPDEQAADLIESLPPADAANIVSEMQSDEQADLLADLEDEDAEAILSEMPRENADEVRKLVKYDDEVAGGLMITEYLSFPETVSVGEVVDELSSRAEEITEYFTRYAYALSSKGRLTGVVEVRDLVLTSRYRSFADVVSICHFVEADADLDALKVFFDEQGIVAAPVVDRMGRLLGVIRRTAVLDALAERGERQKLRMQGIVGGDEIRALPLAVRARRRLSWLSVNILLNVMAASVIAAHIETLEAVIALAVFLPIISDMSGCSGNQAVAVSMRELSLGLVKPNEALRVWLQEVSVGVLNGLALGLLLGCVAWVWKGNPFLGLVVGGALMLNTMVAVSIGGTVPLLLKRMGVDPALASGPLLTTVTDICGFFFVLSFAALMLPLLV